MIILGVGLYACFVQCREALVICALGLEKTASPIFIGYSLLWGIICECLEECSRTEQRPSRGRAAKMLSGGSDLCGVSAQRTHP